MFPHARQPRPPANTCLLLGSASSSAADRRLCERSGGRSEVEEMRCARKRPSTRALLRSRRFFTSAFLPSVLCTIGIPKFELQESNSLLTMSLSSPRTPGYLQMSDIQENTCGNKCLLAAYSSFSLTCSLVRLLSSGLRKLIQLFFPHLPRISEQQDCYDLHSLLDRHEDTLYK